MHPAATDIISLVHPPAALGSIIAAELSLRGEGDAPDRLGSLASTSCHRPLA